MNRNLKINQKTNMADINSISDSIVTLQINDRINFTRFYIRVHLEKSGFDLKNEIELEHEGLSANNIRLIFAGRVLDDYFSLYHQGIKHGSIIFLIAKKVSNRRVTPSMQISRLSELINCYYALINGKVSKSSPCKTSNSYNSISNPNESFQANDLRSIINEISDIITNPIVKASARIYSEFQMKIEEAYEIVQSGNSLQNGLYGNNIYFSTLTQKNVLFAARTHDIAFDQVESTPEGFRLLQSIVKEIEQNSINGSMDNNESSFFASGLHANAISSASSWYGKGKQKTNLNFKSEISVKPLPQCWCRPSSLAAASPTYFMNSKPSLIMTRTAIPSNKSSRANNFYQSTSKFDDGYSQKKNSNQQLSTTCNNVSNQNKSEIESESISSENNSNRNPEISSIIKKEGNNNNENPSLIASRSLSITQSKMNKHANSSTTSSSDSPAIFGISIGLNSVTSSRSQKEITNKSGKSDDSDYAECNVSTDDDERSDAKEKFALQLDTLKSMGFSDDETILRALMEADGNVQLAVRILKQNRVSSVK